MLRRFLLILPLLLAGCAYQSHYARPDDNGEVRLQYNHVEDEYEYTEKDDQLRYNYIEDEYEYAQEDAKLRYNHIEDRYEYE